MDAGTQNGKLREAASAQRRLLDSEMVDYVADGGIGLVHQRRFGNRDRGRDFTRLQGAVYGRGAIALHEDLGMDFGLEAGAGEGNAIDPDGEIGNVERAIRLGRNRLLQAGGQILDLDCCVVDDGAGDIRNRARDGAESLLRGR